ncbi:PREDICTED: peptidyl-prolyl cis-trans isomerase FKBP43-like [Nicotiana attenuata]|uniref:peptidyl-prolyl cis-trans isomerase FKBP43-like n=1 Tax=Nicotiana attenuata TaxID=49451 RepID=UPI0009054E0E|nr:PREDICTED: peptidyl-prolyl cis-trans isomerase FKBP43-like [Nicotiana attenuata]
MAFWGAFIEPGKPYTLKLHNNNKRRVRISQATLGERSGLWKSRSIVRCAIGSQPPISICSLCKEIHCCQLDLEFEEFDDVVFSVVGPRGVHLAGYYLSSRETTSKSTGTDELGVDLYGEDISNAVCERNIEVTASKPALLETQSGADDNDDAGKIELLVPVEGRGTSFNNIATDCGLKEDTPKAMNKGNCPLAIIPCQKPIIGKDSNRSPQPVNEVSHSRDRKKRKTENQENRCDSNISSFSWRWKIEAHLQLLRRSIRVPCHQILALSDGMTLPRASNKSPEPVTEMCHSQDRTKEKKRKIENQENRYDSNILSQLEMENRSSLANPKEITESCKAPQILTLSNGVTFEVLVKGKQDGKVASTGKQVKIYFIAKLRGTGCVVGSNIGEAPHRFRLGDKNMVKGLNIGIEGMHVGEKRRLTVPPSLGFGKKARPPVPADSWLQYDIELVDICE